MSYAIAITHSRPIAKLIGANIKQVRGSRSQSAIALRAGVAQGNLSRIEAGRQEPTVDTVAALAVALGVPTRRLLVGVDEHYDDMRPGERERWARAVEGHDQ